MHRSHQRQMQQGVLADWKNSLAIHAHSLKLITALITTFHLLVNFLIAFIVQFVRNLGFQNAASLIANSKHMKNALIH